MTKINELPGNENTFEFIQDFTNFAFEIGYSYTKANEYKHIAHITFAFWNLNIIW